jgi:hypothetical protein
MKPRLHGGLSETTRKSTNRAGRVHVKQADSGRQSQRARVHLNGRRGNATLQTSQAMGQPEWLEDSGSPLRVTSPFHVKRGLICVEGID